MTRWFWALLLVFPQSLSAQAQRVRAGGKLPAGWQKVESKRHSSADFDVFRIKNFAGEDRYLVRPKSRQPLKPGKLPKNNHIMLYLTRKAMESGAPVDGYMRQTDHSSCGPVGTINLFRWHGIEKLDSKVSLKPLRLRMRTDRWRPSLPVALLTEPLLPKGLGLPGTCTPHFIAVTRAIANTHMPKNYRFVSLHGGAKTDFYGHLCYLLSAGSPVVVNYKVGSLGGHYALLVGIKAVPDVEVIKTKTGTRKQITYADPNNDILYFANGRPIRWKRFRDLWERRYIKDSFVGKIPFLGDMVGEVPQWMGEHKFVRVFVFPKNRMLTVDSTNWSITRVSTAKAERMAELHRQAARSAQKQKDKARREGIILQEP